MTTPQMITTAGVTIFILALTFIFEYEDFGLDRLFGAELQLLIGIPVMIFGVLVAIAGLFGEQIQEIWINKNRDDDEDGFFK